MPPARVVLHRYRSKAMLARGHGAARLGVTASVVDVEVDLAARGVAAFRLVGLAPGAARGMEQRILAALRNSGFTPPTHPVTVNFAPASLPKEAPPLDLALAAALLASMTHVPCEALASALFHGELALDGRVRPVAGALAAAEAARAAGLSRFACAAEVAAEASAVRDVAVHPVRDLREVVALLNDDGPQAIRVAELAPEDPSALPDLSDLRGQSQARRALELAAAGGHGLLLVGPPGAGKSMLARRLPGILPPLDLDEAIEVTRVHSAAGLLLRAGPSNGLMSRRPFRSPHHSISPAGLVGGGRPVSPGELSLAHLGVLFLDELPEFRRDVLESLRQPLEEGRLSLVRANGATQLPCRTTLIAAMNPCPCGWFGARVRECSCTDGAVARYRARLSGPLLDRLDLQVDVPALSFAEISSSRSAEASAVIRERVIAARAIQLMRQRRLNGRLLPGMLRRVVTLDAAARSLLEHAVDRLGISGRAHDRVLQVALTVRDLDAAAEARAHAGPHVGAVKLSESNVAEALSHRALDRLSPTEQSARDAARSGRR